MVSWEILLFLPIFVMPISGQCTSDVCTVGGRLALDWNYNNTITTTVTRWTLNGADIMGKTSSGLILDPSYIGRLNESDRSNAGFLLYQMNYTDVGTYAVRVTFASGTAYQNNADVSVIAANLNNSVSLTLTSGFALLNGINKIGLDSETLPPNSPYNITVDLTCVCTPLDNITVTVNGQDYISPSGQYYFYHEVTESDANVSVTIYYGSNVVKTFFPINNTGPPDVDPLKLCPRVVRSVAPPCVEIIVTITVILLVHFCLVKKVLDEKVQDKNKVDDDDIIICSCKIKNAVKNLIRNMWLSLCIPDFIICSVVLIVALVIGTNGCDGDDKKTIIIINIVIFVICVVTIVIYGAILTKKIKALIKKAKEEGRLGQECQNDTKKKKVPTATLR